MEIKRHQFIYSVSNVYLFKIFNLAICVELETGDWRDYGCDQVRVPIKMSG